MRFLLGEVTFTDLMGVEECFNISGVSSSNMSECLLPVPKSLSSEPVNCVIGVMGELRHRRELLGGTGPLSAKDSSCEIFLNLLFFASVFDD